MIRDLQHGDSAAFQPLAAALGCSFTADDLLSAVAKDSANNPAKNNPENTASGVAPSVVHNKAFCRIIALPEQGFPIAAFYIGRIVFEAVELLFIGVDAECRRRALASQLLDDLYATSLAAGCTRVELEVRESNSAARALYERQGFVLDGRRPRYYAPLVPAGSLPETSLLASLPASSPATEREAALLYSRPLS